jgi:hypothetical protein
MSSLVGSLLAVLVFFLVTLGMSRFFRRLCWWFNPNHAPVSTDGRWSTCSLIVVRVRNHGTAKKWISSPPRLNVNGFEGLAWLALIGDDPSRELLFDVFLESDPVYVQVRDAVQDEMALQREILRAVGGRKAG